MIKKILKLLLFLLIILFEGCSPKNILTEDDYSIARIVLDKYIIVNNFDGEPSLMNYDKDSHEYSKIEMNLWENQDYVNNYYYSIDEFFYRFSDDRFIIGLLEKNNFNTKDISKLISLKIDYNKINFKRNLLRVNKNSDLMKSKNYVGDYRLSRVLYDGSNRACIIFSEKEGRRGLVFLKKENNIWTIDFSTIIPYKMGDEEITL